MWWAGDGAGRDHGIRVRLRTLASSASTPNPGAYSLPPSRNALSHTRRKSAWQSLTRMTSIDHAFAHSLHSPSLNSLAHSFQGCERRSLHPTWV